MKKQQTAVEWLVDQLTDELHEAYHPVLAKLYQASKEMERKQIVDARSTAPILDFSFDHQDYADEAEQYYNETYGDERDTKSI